MTLTTRARKRAAALLSIGVGAAGLGAVLALLALGTPPRQWWMWGLLATAFVALEFAAVEISERIRISSSLMVAFTAAVVLGRDQAAPAVALMAAVAMLQPADIAGRRWQQPLFNFGQLVLSASAGILVFALFLPSDGLSTSDLPLVVLGAALGAGVYDYLNYQLVAGFVRLVYAGREMPSWTSLMGTHAALALLAVLGALLGAAYLLVGPIITPLILATYVVGHVGFSTNARLRQAHESTVRGLVKVVEALDPYTKGHTERVAHFCHIMAEEMGLTWERMERLRWAALLHDVSKLAVPAELARREGELSRAETEEAVRHRRVVDGVLADVGFLRPMVEITMASQALLAGPEPWRPARLEARILAAADLFDMRTTTRSYREAVTQAEAFAALRAHESLLGADVLDAFEAAVVRRGEVYGLPDEESAERLARQVRERAIRA
ncbi:MAG: HD domain-containing protein [Actinobacteria bacterium]|nr:HD domain-containing protein [Actinomycetota bacterium]